MVQFMTVNPSSPLFDFKHTFDRLRKDKQSAFKSFTVFTVNSQQCVCVWFVMHVGLQPFIS